MNKDRGFSDEDLAAVSDNPEWTAEDFALAKPVNTLFPELAETMEVVPRGGARRIPVGIDRDLVERFRAGRPNREAALNAALRRTIEPPS